MSVSRNFSIFTLAILVVNQASLCGAKDATSTNNCQIQRPLRKQVEAEPLAGMCLKDIVDRFSKTLRSFSDDELGITLFQETIDKLDLVQTFQGPETVLKDLVEKLNAKLRSYDELLEQCDKAIQDILLKERYFTVYPGESTGQGYLARETVGLCTQIENSECHRKINDK